MKNTIHARMLKAKKFKTIEGLSERFTNSFGQVEQSFIMLVWGNSGNGKSNFCMQMIKELSSCKSILYVSLEEGISLTLQNTIKRTFGDEKINVRFADHNTTFPVLMEYLKKRRSPKIIVIDSIQYFGISYIDYRHLKEACPGKSFIFISHAKGKLPEGKTAEKIRYDAGIKVRVEGYMANVVSRYGGNKPYVIWEEGARRYYGKDYKSVVTGVKPTKEKKQKPKATIGSEVQVKHITPQEPVTKLTIAAPEEKPITVWGKEIKTL